MTRLLAFAVFIAALLYLLLRAKCPTPPEREAGERTPAAVGHGTIQATLVLSPDFDYEREAAVS